MALQESVSVRNARLDAIETTIGTSPRLQIRTGSPPANCAAANSGTLLAELTLPSDWAAAASSGSKALAGTWSGTVSTAGTAGHFRIFDSSVTTCHLQGTITATGGGGDMEVTSTSLAVSDTFNVGTFTLSAGNS